MRCGLAAVLFLFFITTFTAAQDGSSFSIDTSPLPAPTGFVNDFAGVIDEASKARLEEALKNLRDTTNPSVEIAVAVVRTTGDRPISDYSLAVARGWKIGSKEDDNPSALLFVAIDDRKYFTQISRNLEDELPDAMVGALQRRFLVPEFRQGNYAKGISDTIDAYIARIREAGNAPVNANANTAKRDTGRGTGIVSGGIGTGTCCIIIVLILVILAASRFGRRKSGYDRDRWGGGGFGGGGGLGSALPWIVGGMLSGGGGSSGSSSWGGSSDRGGGGSDWGGFGGGGDFGGGGSGGDW